MARSSLGLLLALCVAFVGGSARADVTAFFGSPGPCAGAAPSPPIVEPIHAGGEPSVIPGAVAREDRPVEIARAEPRPEGMGSSMELAPADPGLGEADARTEVTPVAAAADSIPAVEPAPIEPSGEASEPAAVVLAPERSCEPVEIVRVGDGSREHAALVLVDCAGEPDAASLRELSLLARPHGEDRPTEGVLAAHEHDADWIAPRLRRLHPGLLVRLRALADRFPGHPIEIISGYRPSARDGSRHRFGRAIDLRIRGVEVAALDAFARRLAETGVGLYPTTDFIHVDVRTRSAHWIDVSGPGEPPARAPEGSGAADAPAAEPADGTTRPPAASTPSSDRSETGSEDTADEADAAAIGRAAARMLDGFALDLG